ncbi:MAG: ATP-binding protein, partial [Traorella sp.]
KRSYMDIVSSGYDINNFVTMIISDSGNGIENVELAMEPLYTTKSQEERSGMGMTIMQTFSDSFDVISCVNEGTSVVIQKQLQRTK